MSTVFIDTCTVLLTKTTAAQNEVALSYLSVRGLYFLAVVFAAITICALCITCRIDCSMYNSM